VNHTGDKPQNNPKYTTVAIIPARFASTRLPGKALIEIAGKPMVCWVAERARAARNVDRVIVATDSDEIASTVRANGIEVAMTSATHTSGTDRVAEVAAAIPEAEIIVNVQGDEPLISPQTIEKAVDVMANEMRRANEQANSEGNGLTDGVTNDFANVPKGAGIVTTWEAIESAADLFDPDLVKVVVDDDDNAIYFSRSPVPFPRDAAKRYGSPELALEEEPDLLKLFRKHTGLYVYRRDVLLEFTNWPQTQLEQIEGLEQLRALAHGVKIKVVEACSTSIGVDTPVDLERVRSTISGSITGATNA
jgi:3-deoxy-manno-octulosonate cytidylyltransferase (CMP-KDO synthetase)